MTGDRSFQMCILITHYNLCRWIVAGAISKINILIAHYIISGLLTIFYDTICQRRIILVVRIHDHVHSPRNLCLLRPSVIAQSLECLQTIVMYSFTNIIPTHERTSFSDNASSRPMSNDLDARQSYICSLMVQWFRWIILVHKGHVRRDFL